MTKAFQAKLRKPSSRSARPEKAPFWQTYILVPAIPLVVGFGLGLATEWRKDVSTEERLYLEQRMKVFATTSDHFAPYVLNWGRTLKMAHYKWGLANKRQQLNKLETAEREKNLDARRMAKDQLYAQLEVAKLFFRAYLFL